MNGGELPLAGDARWRPRSSKPMLLVVRRDPALARALENALRSRFGEEGFDAHCVDTVEGAFALIAGIRESGGRLALVIADQDIGLSGAAVISTTHEVHPQARTVVLIRHEDMESALRGLNDGVLDHFLVKPLGDYDRQLLPVVSDLLEDWKRRAEDADRAVRVIGDPDSAETLELREFLHGNDIHHRFLNPGASEEARALVEQQDGGLEQLPMVVLEDESKISRPSPLQLASAIGLQTQAQRLSYDLAIVGGGPAGLAAAVYGASEGLTTILVERFAPGGQAGQSARIENYLGFPGGLSGSDLAQRALRQARRFRAEIVRPCEASGLDVRDPSPVLKLIDGPELACQTVLIACGVAYCRLEVPGIERLVGRGVYYGAGVSDAEELAGRRVVVVGGANSAGQAALHFAEHAASVTLLVRSDALARGMSHYLAERIAAHPTIDVRTGTEIGGVVGDGELEGLELSTNGAAGERLEVDAVFVFIGAVPKTEWLPDEIRRDQRGFVLSGRDVVEAGRPPSWPHDRDPYPLETSVPGVFVAGDVRHGSIKRVASAVGEGAMAVQLIHQYLAQLPA